MNNRLPFSDLLEDKFYQNPMFWVVVLTICGMIGAIIYGLCKG
jgi:hypothetical protein